MPEIERELLGAEATIVAGDEHKLALIVVGQLAIGILSPAAVDLGRSPG